MLTVVAAYTFALVSGLIGATSLVLFGVFLWTGAFGVVEIPMGQGSILSWDAALCFLFFLQHSVMVRRSFRARLRHFVPAYAQGILYTLASGVTLIALVVCWQPSAFQLYALEGPGEYLMRGLLLLCLAGVLWGIWSLREFDAFGIQQFLGHVRGISPHPVKLTVRGPYRLIRHPFYCFGIIALWATPGMYVDRLIFNLLFSFWIVFGARMEERDLIAVFGDEYRAYQRSVSMFLPRLHSRPSN